MRVFSSCAAGVSVVPSAKSTSESQMTITDSLFGVCGSYTHTYLCLSSLASHWADSRRRPAPLAGSIWTSVFALLQGSLMWVHEQQNPMEIRNYHFVHNEIR